MGTLLHEPRAFYAICPHLSFGSLYTPPPVSATSAAGFFLTDCQRYFSAFGVSLQTTAMDYFIMDILHFFVPEHFIKLPADFPFYCRIGRFHYAVDIKQFIVFLDKLIGCKSLDI